MAKAKRGMEAVLSKVNKVGRPRKPALKRKGPGIAIMIAVGKPKPGMGEKMDERMGKEPMRDGPMGEKPKGKLAALEARIAELEAQLAAMEEGEMKGGEEEDGEYEDED